MFNHYQTDFGGYVKKDGCLVFTIFSWACLIAGRRIGTHGIHRLIKELHKAGAIGDENDLHTEGVFVYNHEEVFNITLKYLKSKLRVRYKGRIYMPWEEARGKISFGERKGNIIIFQIKTVLGNGHFRNPFYDPYRPSPAMADLKSLRYYEAY